MAEVEEVYCPACYERNGNRITTQMVNRSPSNYGYFKCPYGHITRKKIEDYEKDEKTSAEGENKLDKD